MPNLTETDYKKMKIDENLQTRQFKLDNEDSYHERRIVTKTLKMNENNQYRFALTKPIPTGCIKEHLARS